MEEVKKKVTPEVKPGVKPEVKQTPQEEIKTFARLGELTLMKENYKTFKRGDELKEAQEAVKKINGLKAKKTKTVWCRSTKMVLVEGYPTPKILTDLFSDKQKKIYFS